MKNRYDKRTAAQLAKMRVSPKPPGKRPLAPYSAYILRTHAKRIAATHPDAHLMAFHQKRLRSRWDVGEGKSVCLRGFLKTWTDKPLGYF